MAANASLLRFQKLELTQLPTVVCDLVSEQLGQWLLLLFWAFYFNKQVDAEQHTLAKYLMELTVINYSMVHVYPSEIAAAALCLALKVLDQSKWVSLLDFDIFLMVCNYCPWFAFEYIIIPRRPPVERVRFSSFKFFQVFLSGFQSCFRLATSLQILNMSWI